MCRWLAYSGDPVFLDELLFKPEHSLIEQSRSSYASTTPTNADGYGVGWYGERETPGLYRASVRPGTIATSAISRSRSVPIFSSRTSVRPPERRSNRPTVTRFAMESGPSFTTG